MDTGFILSSPKFGAWTKRGCTATYSNITHTECKCIHTGMFAVLGEVEVSKNNEIFMRASVSFMLSCFSISCQ